MAEVGELLEEISSALLRYQAEKRIPQGYLLQHDTVVYELARNRRNTLVFVTNGVIPMVVVNRMEAVLMCEKMPKVRSEISVVRVFSVGNVSYFALGYKDGTMLVFSCKTDSKELTLVVQFASSSEEDLKGSGREIFYIQQQPINCLNRFQENLVYMWVGFGSKVMLVTFKTEQMNGALGVMLEYRINEAKLGKLVQVEIHNSAYGTNTMTAFHFWSPGAARIVALDARQALFWAEKVSNHHLRRYLLSFSLLYLAIIAMDIQLYSNECLSVYFGLQKLAFYAAASLCVFRLSGHSIYTIRTCTSFIIYYIIPPLRQHNNEQLNNSFSTSNAQSSTTQGKKEQPSAFHSADTAPPTRDRPPPRPPSR